MTFLNIILLAGMSAAVVPIVIHFLHRRRPTPVRWGAMHLIAGALRQNSVRLKWEQRLLLTVRFLIPALLAVSMARPVLTRNRALLGHGKKSLVILLDNSYSMESGGGENSSFTEAKSAAARILENLDPGSDASVLLMAGGEDPDRANGSQNLAGLAQEIKNLEAGYGRADVPGSLHRAVEYLSHSPNRNREVVILSDFQRISWPVNDFGARSNASAVLRGTNNSAEITLWRVGHENQENVSVESLELPPNPVAVNRPCEIRANLHNYADQPWSDLRVFLRVDGRERAASQITLGARETGHVLFSYSFDRPGSHLIQVFAEADTLEADNGFTGSVTVVDKIPLLLVSGNLSKVPLQGETDFLEVALQPFGKGVSGADTNDLIQCKVIAPEQLTQELLFTARSVVLANVRQLTEPQVQWLKTFVSEGGGCVVFPGDRINAEWYNRLLASSAEPFLPAAFMSIRGGENVETHVTVQNLLHPILQIFNDDRNGKLSDISVRFWYETGEVAGSGVGTLARLENGNAFLLERKFGEGRVIQMAVSCDNDWCDLPTRAFYAPFMQRLITYLSTTEYPARNIPAGSPLLWITLPEYVGKSASLVDSSGRRHELIIQSDRGRGTVQFAHTDRPGIYTLTMPDGNLVYFVATTSREESNLDSLSTLEQKAVAKEMHATLVRATSEYEQLDYISRFGHELWQKVLLAVIGLVFFELVFQHYLTGRRL